MMQHAEGHSSQLRAHRGGRGLGDTINLRAPSASRAPVRPDWLIGVELQGYVITRVISSGGMGVVYEARHSLLGIRAAVKVVRPEYSEDPELNARFLREAQAIRLVQHRNVVEILNFGVLPSGGQYLMMEFLEGETLRELIERSGPIAPSLVLPICEEILAGLAAVHQVSVVHRDLKPANIMLCRQSYNDLLVKVCDFGLARRFDARAEGVASDLAVAQRSANASISAGTPEYESPEQALGRRVDGQADLYCLGVILFEMLAGRLPFEATSAADLLQQHCHAQPPRVSDLIPLIPEGIDALVAQLLAKEPQDRPPGATAARYAVRRLILGLRPR